MVLNRLLGEMQRVAFSPIAIVGLSVRVRVYVCMYVTLVDHKKTV